MEAPDVVNLTTSAYLLGLCPLFAGMQVRLSHTLENATLHVREVTGTVQNIQFHDRGPSDWHGRDASQPAVVQYLPVAIVVELDAADMKITRFCDGLVPGYVLIPPEEGQWTWRRTIATGATCMQCRFQVPCSQPPLRSSCCQNGLNGRSAATV